MWVSDPPLIGSAKPLVPTIYVREDDASMMTKQDYLISIENSANALFNAGRAADVAHVFRLFGHGTRSLENLSPSDYDAVFGELYQREIELED